MTARSWLARDFGTKLTLLVTATTGVAVVLVCAVLVIVDHLKSKQEEVELARAQTEMAALYSEAPLSFGDPTVGEEALATLRAAPNVAYAALYRPTGELFAAFSHESLRVPTLSRGGMQEPGTYFDGSWLIVNSDVVGAADGAGPASVLGRLQVVYDLRRIWPRTWFNISVATLVAASTIMIAFIASTRLRRFLTRPVNELAKTARHVARTSDYTVRAAKFSNDELGQLTDVFNNMLAQVHHQAEEIQNGQKQFRLAVEAAPNAMVMVDEHGTIMLVNAKTEEMFGYGREELMGQSVDVLVPERFRPRHPQFRSGFFTDPQSRPMGAGRDLFGRHKFGHEIPVEIGLNPIRTDEGLRVLSSIVDITERKRAESDLRESEARKAGIMESALDCLITMDHQGRIIDFNPAAERTFGYPREEAVGNTVAELLIPPRLRELHWRGLKHYLATGENRVLGQRMEVTGLRADGTEIPVELAISVIQLPDRSPFFTAYLRDITDEKKRREEREMLLESERVARTEAERASRMKDEFVATLSHELRTPMSAILGWAQMLRSGTSTPEETTKGMEVIERNARVQTQIIEDLLDMSRIVSGKIRLDVQQVNLVDVIEAAVATIRPAADAKQIRLQVTLDPRSAPVRGDPGRLQQVVWNLLTNAIKFTPRSGRVQVSLERINSHVEIIVSDTGQGISEEFLPYLFERFRQADASTTRRHGGLGLGLAIVKQLVELHGGTAHAKSSGEGQGSTFIVKLPLMVMHGPADKNGRAHPAVPLPTPTIEKPSLDGIRVLVVDDEADSCELVKRLLENHKATVCCATSAADALREYERFKPDVLVSDIGMPEMDGYELMRQVRTREKKAGAHTPGLALTAFARPEDRMRALLAGFQMHMSKPVEPAELLVAVGSLAAPGRR